MKTIKTPLSLIVGGALGAFLIAAIGVSAHTTGLAGFSFTSQHHSESSDVASGAREEPKDSPEPSEKPEPTAKPTAEPTEKPETDETETETETGDSAPKTSAPNTTHTDEESGGKSTSGEPSSPGKD
jgi:outer membrane biosynthesis protein TonB